MRLRHPEQTAMSRTPTNFLTATETQALVRSGKVSVTQVLSDHVGRYKDRNGQVGAWVHVKHDEGVMGGEEDVDRPLYGVTLGVKDIMGESGPSCIATAADPWADTNDMPTEHGCQIYKGAQAGVDAAVVGICRQAGAAIIGKTVSLAAQSQCEKSGTLIGVVDDDDVCGVKYRTRNAQPFGAGAYPWRVLFWISSGRSRLPVSHRLGYADCRLTRSPHEKREWAHQRP